MSVIYSIKHWDNLYENSKSRTVEKTRWVLIPNRHDGLGYKTIMRRPNGPALFGAWITLVQIASRCKKRGTLADSDGEPYTAEDLSLMTDIPTALYEELLEVASNRPVQWLERKSVTTQKDTSGILGGYLEDTSVSGSGGGNPAQAVHVTESDNVTAQTDTLVSDKGIEGNIKERNTPPLTPPPKSAPAKPSPRKVASELPLPDGLDTDTFKAKWQEWVSYRITQGGVKAWEAMFKAQLKRLAEMGEAAAVEAMDTAMSNGWKGLFQSQRQAPQSNSGMQATVNGALALCGKADSQQQAKTETVWQIKQRIEAIEHERKQIRARGWEDAFGWHADNDKDSARLRELRQLREELNRSLVERN